MAGIITEQYRKVSAELLLNDISTNGNTYYVGIGKSDEWYQPLSNGEVAPFPAGSRADTFDAQCALTDLIKVTPSKTARVIPYVELTASRYKTYDPYDPSCFYPGANIKPCYVVDSNGFIFVCLKNTASQFTPNGTSLGDKYSISVVNNYIWAYVGSTIQYSFINSDKFVVVDTEDSLDGTESTDSSGGLIFGFKIINGGTSYVGSPSITVYGVDATGNNVQSFVIPSSTVTVQNGSIVAVDASAQLLLNASLYKKGYVSAYCTLTSGNAILAPMIAPIKGFGWNATDCSPAWYVGFLANTRDAVRTVYSDYAQVSLVRNPKTSAGVNLTNPVYRTTKSFTVTDVGVLATVQPGYGIEQNGRKVGVVDTIEDVTVHYVNSVKYGFSTLIPGQGIQFVSPSGTRVPAVATIPVSIATLGPFDQGSGEVMFMDNRASITRAEDQNEELKIIIQL